ncbi:MAG: peptidylprolyl isomerase, partial [Caulobacteraceae bacterium]
MLAAAFGQGAGGDTEVTDLGKGEYYVLRVEKIMPAALPKVDEIRPQLTRVYMSQQLVKALQARAEALAARVTKGESIEAVAASAGSKVNTISGVSRVNAAQYQALGQDLLAKLIASKPNEVFSAAAPNGVAVVRTVRVTSPPPQMAAAIGASQRTALTGQMFKEMGELVKTSARDRIKVQVNRDRALRAINVNPEEVGDTPQTGAKSGAPAKAAE